MNKKDKQDLLLKLRALAEPDRNPNLHEVRAAQEKIAELSRSKRRGNALPKGIRIRNGSYVAYVTLHGEPVLKTVGRVGCITPKQAANLRADLEKQIRDGLYPPAPKAAPAPQSPVMTCADLWNPYLADCQNREKRVDRLKTA
jgi:hypothetical protein